MKKRLKGDDIRRIREELHLTQARFADAVGVVDKAIVSRWESGKHRPHLIYRQRIAELADG